MKWLKTLGAICVILALGIGAFLRHSASGDFFTLVVLPDTQRYSESYPDTFYAQTDWIVKNRDKEKIVFVTHVGDIIENGHVLSEWDLAQKAMSRLDGQVPWGVVPGNHDFDRQDDPQGVATHYLKNFGPQRFKAYEWFGEASENGMNTSRFFTIGPYRILSLHLEPDVPDEAIEWAESVIARYPSLPVMMTTHIYLKESGELTNWPHCRPMGNSGFHLWQKLVSKYPQIFMVISGHFSFKDGEATQVKIADGGNPVIQMLSDYQDRAAGGGGLLRLVRFYPALKKIKVRTYSPVTNRFETDRNSQFDLPLDLSAYAA